MIGNEQWCEISGFNGRYSVSNTGRIRSNKYTIKQFQPRYNKFIERTFQEQLLIPEDNGKGYLMVALRNQSGKKNYYIHRLVASAFIKEIPQGMVVNHKDFNTKNNCVENLEIISQKQNINYSSSNMSDAWLKRVINNEDVGIIYRPKTKNYELVIRRKYLGKFATKEEAIARKKEYLENEVI